MATRYISHSSHIQLRTSSLSPPYKSTNLSKLSIPSLKSFNGGSPLLKKEYTKIPLSVSGNTFISPLVSDSKTTNPVIVIDNYDSFTYNLCQTDTRVYTTLYLPIEVMYIGELGCTFEVYRNDELTVDELKQKNPRGILISPGPGEPKESGISLQTVLELGPTVPLFGVCMGLQCIGEAFGGKIVRSPYGVMHGKSSLVYYNEGGEDGLFAGLSNPFTAGRYHSLVIEKDSFPSNELEITAWTEDGLVMGVRHKRYRFLQGVQFHPESIITTEGKTIVQNFIKLLELKQVESQN